MLIVLVICYRYIQKLLIIRWFWTSVLEWIYMYRVTVNTQVCLGAKIKLKTEKSTQCRPYNGSINKENEVEDNSLLLASGKRTDALCITVAHKNTDTTVSHFSSKNRKILLWSSFVEFQYAPIKMFQRRIFLRIFEANKTFQICFYFPTYSVWMYIY